MSRHGQVVYLELPADDVDAAVDFYTRLFGWRTRRRGDDAVAFDDPSGKVSGAWRTGRPAQSEPGVLVYLNVDDVAVAVDEVTASGGEVIQGVGGDPGELTARFRDPSGNVLGLYQEPV